jgi:hypothetical protein
MARAFQMEILEGYYRDQTPMMGELKVQEYFAQPQCMFQWSKSLQVQDV